MPHRSCCVEIINNSEYFSLTNPRVFTESGHCEVPPPPTVRPCSMGSAMFNKTTGAATGAVGVLTYDLVNADNDFSQTLAIMYSVPFDHNIYSNWYAVGVLELGVDCDYNLYDSMYNGSENGFVRGLGNGSSMTLEGEFLLVGASMSENGEAALRVDVNDRTMLF